ncbi:sucrase ferredoxin [Aphanothece hegewaldii CCALA 016]|uniref:Sucrase ferredoxin n=1 Tax=Aphanothece hegewaldii CCALA 016 TaxID=2107694 RepID=A0A2T1LUL0_9CHRO|nr:sucrase ferredoxin [Aphanothece hegewaldii]PSF35025.1 sucrase ferredoxin [Aphanothece hegewaldii CCALA 016]
MNLTDCRFCSEVSKNNGEDPIGTAGTYEHWLILELKQPWSPMIWVDDPRVKSLVDLMKKLILWRGFNIRVLAIAPDPEYSITGYARLFYYRRPSRFFSEFNKQEFLVPESNLISLATALLKNNTKVLNNFEQYRQDTNHIRDILVCTHANVDVACGRFGYPIYKQLRSKYAAHSNGQLRVWRCSHFGGHQFAPTFIDLPQGHYWGHVEPEILDLIIHRTGSVSDLGRFYRGWSGLKPLEQIVEREIWIKEGWDWLKYAKSGRILEIKGRGIIKHLYPVLQSIPIQPLQILFERWAKNNITQAKIRIECKTSDQRIFKAYEAIVERQEPVISAAHSAQEIHLKPVQQYRVSHLTKING